MVLELLVNIFLSVFALGMAILAFFVFRQVRFLNRFLSTPLGGLLNLLAFLFFLFSLVTFGVTLFMFW